MIGPRLRPAGHPPIKSKMHRSTLRCKYGTEPWRYLVVRSATRVTTERGTGRLGLGGERMQSVDGPGTLSNYTHQRRTMGGMSNGKLLSCLFHLMVEYCHRRVDVFLVMLLTGKLHGVMLRRCQTCKVHCTTIALRRSGEVHRRRKRGETGGRRGGARRSGGSGRFRWLWRCGEVMFDLAARLARLLQVLDLRAWRWRLACRRGLLFRLEGTNQSNTHQLGGGFFSFFEASFFANYEHDIVLINGEKNGLTISSVKSSQETQ